MEIGLIQLSDLHIKSNEDLLVKNVKEISSSVNNLICNCTKVVIVVSGDIIDTGKTENYSIAKKFFNDLQKSLKEINKKIETIDFVVVPGNHDMNFDKSQYMRNLVINSEKNKSNLTEEDEALRHLLEPQTEFWKFAEELEGQSIKTRVSYKKEINITEGTSLTFLCYNTALFSTKKENAQDLVVPKNYFIECDNERKTNIIISVFHHKPSWLSTNMSDNENNQSMFENHLEKTSQIVMCGHEHQSTSKKTSKLDKGETVFFLECPSMQLGKEKGFNVIILDSERLTCEKYGMTIDNEYKIHQPETSILLSLEKKKEGGKFSNQFLNQMEDLGAPIKKNSLQLKLEDVFVYPDLEPLNPSDDNRLITYLDSCELLDWIRKNNTNIVILEGQCQCGKSSLLRKLLTDSYYLSKYPLLLNGEDLGTQKDTSSGETKFYINVDDVIKKAYKKQYDTKNCDFDQYLQLNNKEKIIFIDDLDKSSLNKNGIENVIERLRSKVGTLIIAMNERHDIKDILRQSPKSEIKYFYIKEFGHVKRNELIEKWIKLGEDPYSYNENQYTERLSNTFDIITKTLGKHLLPSYPLFLLTILQQLDTAPFDVKPTTYAELYKSLIMALLKREGINVGEYDGIIKYMSGIAFFLFDNDKTYITHSELKKYHNDYEKNYNCTHDEEGMLNLLKKAGLLKEEGVDISFVYKYLYYYLVASHIVSLCKEDKNEIIEKLSSCLHKEKCANILIFLAYLEQDNKDLLFALGYASLLPFEKQNCISMTQDDKIVKEFFNLKDSLIDDLRTNVDPEENRKNKLKAQDEFERNSTESIKEEEIEENEVLKDINNMFKVIQIIGQVIKTQRYVLEKGTIEDLISNSYRLCFRTISFFSNYINESKDDLLKALTEENPNAPKMDYSNLVDKVQKFLYFLLIKICDMSIFHLVYSIGAKGIQENYEKVRDSFNTPVAEIVTFMIKSRNTSINVDELGNLMKKYEKNELLKHLLKSTVRNYVYTHDLDYSQKQKLGNIAEMKLIDNPKLTRNTGNTKQ